MSPLTVALVVGYFDSFSGYQETVLASALRRYASVEVIASDRVSPIFSDEHLARIGQARRYPVGTTEQDGIRVTRFASLEVRSMVWSRGVARHLRGSPPDLIIQVMPGQGLPAAPSFARTGSTRVALYGDNQAMWSDLSRSMKAAKRLVFSCSKGLAYTFVNWRANRVYGYTPDTQRRLSLFSAGKKIDLLPLGADGERFYLQEDVRHSARSSREYAPTDIVVTSAGKFSPSKRLEVLIEAVGAISKSSRNVKLLLVGADDTQYSQSLREYADLVAPGRVRFEPFVPSSALNEVFAAADIGIWPRQPAITIQQALLAGLFTLLPRNPIVEHLLAPGSGEYFVDADERRASVVESALSRAIDLECYGSSERQARARRNSWLSGDALARRLLDDNGFRVP